MIWLMQASTMRGRHSVWWRPSVIISGDWLVSLLYLLIRVNTVDDNIRKTGAKIQQFEAFVKGAK
jgi:hypothetical protein